MKAASSRRSGRYLLGAAVAVLAVAGPAAGAAMADPGALFTQTNDPAGNVVAAYDRGSDGTLTAAGTVATGGLGSAAAGGRQGAVTLSGDGRTVYAVNAGSNTVTVLRRDRDGLRNVGSAPSGGSLPVSVDERLGRVYVLNSGDPASVSALRAGPDGGLTPIPGGTQPLPGVLGAAQVSVSPDGRALVVSERLSNRLETLPLDRSGVPGAPVVTASSGAVPFGFAFGRRDELVVSEAGASTVSSYRLGDDGGLATITASAPVGQGAACWVAVTPSGRYAYTGNASGSISGFAVDRDGALTPAGTTTLTPSPRDLAFTREGRFLYAVSPGSAAAGGVVTGYRVGSDGSLDKVTTAPAPAGITGAAAE
jgi:6-phosphogluconolactonase